MMEMNYILNWKKYQYEIQILKKMDVDPNSLPLNQLQEKLYWMALCHLVMSESLPTLLVAWLRKERAYEWLQSHLINMCGRGDEYN